MRLRDITPRGFQARNFLILIVPMITLLISMTLFFFNSHVHTVNTKLSRSVAKEFVLAVIAYEADPEGWPRFVQSMSDVGMMQLSVAPGATFDPRRVKAAGCCEQLADQLETHLGRPFSYVVEPGSERVRVMAPVSDGVLTAALDRKRAVVITAHIFIVWTVGFSLLLLAASYLFLRNQVRSIVELSRAADALGRGEDAPGYRPSGAREVREAARALIRMRNRLRRYADQRTAMLAGVSHDLRTPLTRLKLELALLPKEIDTAAARADIVEMERMLDGYLAFARGEESEQVESTDLAALAREAASHAASRARVEFDLPDAAPVNARVRPLSVKRAIANLANNAADHAAHVRITVRREPGGAVVVVEDDGPGIPADRYEEAFRPFSRLDGARNQNVSGVGLGLTIARDAARAHGGALTLGRSSLGGLSATFRLPHTSDA